jgi:glyoxylase-like metal-dependent hydrolase (beta-lactamase superfamily II)
VTSPDSGADGAADLPDYAPIPQSALGPALNDQGYYVGRVERNLYWVTDGVYNCAFLATRDGVVVFDAPPSIGGNLRRAIDQVTAEGVTNTVTHFVYSHHHADHGGAAFLFSAREALATVNPVPYWVAGGENAWAGVKGYLDVVTERAAAPVVAKYTGVLAAADIEVFTRTTTFAIMQSLRLDRGPSGPVHP